MSDLSWIDDYIKLHGQKVTVSDNRLKTGPTNLEQKTVASLSKSFGKCISDRVTVKQERITDPFKGWDFRIDLYTITPENFRLLVARIRTEIDDAYRRGGMDK